MLIFSLAPFLSVRTLLRLHSFDNNDDDDDNDISFWLKDIAQKKIGHSVISIKCHEERCVLMGKMCILWNPWEIRVFMLDHRNVYLEGIIDSKNNRLVIQKISLGCITMFKKMIRVLRRTFKELIIGTWVLCHETDLLVKLKDGQLWLPAYMHLTVFDETSNSMDYFKLDSINEQRTRHTKYKV